MIICIAELSLCKKDALEVFSTSKQVLPLHKQVTVIQMGAVVNKHILSKHLL